MSSPVATTVTSLTACDANDLAAKLLGWFDSARQYAVALSGGVDSAVVAKAAHLATADAVAVTGCGPSVAQREMEDATAVVASIGIRHERVLPGEIDNPAYQQNDARRCYYCKSHLFSRLVESYPNRIILSGTNHDDLSDYRPGLDAARESAVRAPLAELRLGKQQVRLLARAWELSVAEKPASPCLASRIAHGVQVTPERLQRVEQAEIILRELGFDEFRVRLHAEELARIEVPLHRLAELMVPTVYARLAEDFKSLGFRFVTLDLDGFRSGSLHPLALPTLPSSMLRQARP